MNTCRRFCAILAILALISCLFCACAGEGTPTPYEIGEHTHVYGYWHDAVPEAEGEPVTKEVRYCKICNQEELREKE